MMHLSTQFKYELGKVLKYSYQVHKNTAHPWFYLEMIMLLLM